jgi:hypothetical protein
MTPNNFGLPARFPDLFPKYADLFAPIHRRGTPTRSAKNALRRSCSHNDDEEIGVLKISFFNQDVNNALRALHENRARGMGLSDRAPSPSFILKSVVHGYLGTPAQ